MNTRIWPLLLTPLFLLAVGCTDQLVVDAVQEPTVQEPSVGGEVDYDMVTLGTLGGSSNGAWAINNGAFVVGSAKNSEGQTRAFVWTEADGMRDLLGSEHEPYNQARHVNHGGQVAGVSSLDRGFVYDLVTDQVVWLVGLPDHTTTQAIAINGDGVVVGRSAIELESGETEWRTVVWIPVADGSYSEPIDLDCPAMQLYSAINRHGDVVANQCGGRSPYLWIRSGDGYATPVVLGTLGGRSTYATGINDHGRVAGWSTAPDGVRKAVLWHPDDYTTPIALGDAFMVLAINNQNEIVGERSARNRRAAVLWTVDDAGGLVAVQELPVPRGYREALARGINDDGWIVGSIWDDSGSTAVLWRRP